MTSTSSARLPSLSLTTLGLILGLAWTTAPAMSQGSQAQREACTGDAMNLCSEFIPDPGRTGACLNAKRAQLSPACRAVFTGSPVRKAKIKKGKRKTKAAKRKSRRRS